MYKHENLKYHEDEVVKTPLSKSEIEFLTKLQEEMNTQDHCGNASPKFWVINGTIREYNKEDGEQILTYDGEELFEDMSSALDYLEETAELDDGFSFRCESGDILAVNIESDKEETLFDLEDVCDFLNKHEHTQNYSITTYEDVEHIYPGTMFLTQKAAEEHLVSNHYHYSKDAHTYAMTAWRSPEVEMLFEILSKTDWKNIKI